MNMGSRASDGLRFLVLDGFGSCEEAFAAAEEVVGSRFFPDEDAQLEVIGDFIIPPRDRTASRDFQTLHFDFGLPLNPKTDQDVARYTALYIDRSAASAAAVTRLVPLPPLLAQRSWPTRHELLARFVAYGRTHGAWDDREGYSEGSVARVIEAAATSSPLLPSVKTEPGFLCGMEFDSIYAEIAFFQRHGLDVEAVEIDLVLRPGQLLAFDNLDFGHGRYGRRQPGELHQRMFGHHQLSPVKQRVLRDRVLSAFDPAPPYNGVASMVSIP